MAKASDVVQDNKANPTPDEAKTDSKTKQAPAKPEAKKLSWRDKAANLLTAKRGRRVAIDAETLQKLAEKRGALLTARLQAAQKGRTAYPSSTIKQYEFELQAILAGNWAPGIMRPKNKEFDKMFYQVGALGTPDKGQVDDPTRVDALLTGE